MDATSPRMKKSEILDHISLKDDVFLPKRTSIFFMLLSIFIVFLSYILPRPQGLSHEGQIMIGILVMAAILWVTEPIPLVVTGLLIMILQPLLGIIPAGEVFASFGNKAAFF